MVRRSKYKITQTSKGSSKELVISKGKVGKGKTGGKWGMEMEGLEYRDVPFTQIRFERQKKKAYRGKPMILRFFKSRVEQYPKTFNNRGRLRIRRK
tara:strand:- start:3416 stop:3703 length:288 start_codon:yes stop_codon:yes gene_type:complete